jgi:hypothetical protein
MMGYRPLCPICNQPVEFPDMHEAIITRGRARGTGLAELGLLYVRENCVLVHPEQINSLMCMIEAAGDEAVYLEISPDMIPVDGDGHQIPISKLVVPLFEQLNRK